MATAIDFAALLKAERASRRAKKAAPKARSLEPNGAVDLSVEASVGDGA